MDGNWKLTFPHCMFPVKAQVSLPLVNFPSVCPNQPQGNTAFCSDHLELAQSLHYPTDIKGFVTYCGAKSAPTGKNKVRVCTPCLHANIHKYLYFSQTHAYLRKVNFHSQRKITQQ